MTRRNIGWIIWIAYIAIWLGIVFISPVFFPGPRSYLTFIPFIFFFPFIHIGRRGYRSRGPQQWQPRDKQSGTQSSVDTDQSNQTGTYTYDEFGIPQRRSNLMIYYIIGGLIFVAGLGFFLYMTYL